MVEPTDAARGTIETPLGEVFYIVNQVDHVYLDAPNDRPLIVNRVPYHTSMHLHLIDGTWKLRNYNELYMSRAGQIGQYASFAAREKTEKILTDAWREFIAENPGLLRVGEIHALTRRVQNAEAEIETLIEKVRMLEGDRDMAVARLRELGYHGPNKQDWSSRF